MEHSYIHSVTCCPWLLSCYGGRIESLWKTTWPQNPEYVLSGPLQKSLLLMEENFPRTCLSWRAIVLTDKNKLLAGIPLSLNNLTLFLSFKDFFSELFIEIWYRHQKEYKWNWLKISVGEDMEQKFYTLLVIVKVSTVTSGKSI